MKGRQISRHSPQIIWRRHPYRNKGHVCPYCSTHVLNSWEQDLHLDICEKRKAHTKKVRDIEKSHRKTDAN